MIIVRNVFQLKFGKAKEGTEVWKEGLTRRSGAQTKLCTGCRTTVVADC